MSPETAVREFFPASTIAADVSLLALREDSVFLRIRRFFGMRQMLVKSLDKASGIQAALTS